MERDELMKKLVEVEMDGQAAVKQMAALRDSIRRLREVHSKPYPILFSVLMICFYSQEKRMTSADFAMLTKQKDLLMDRLGDFEGTNRALRRMLRDRHEQEAAALRLSEQRDVLLKKLTETEEDNQRLRSELMAKDRAFTEMRLSMEAQRVSVQPIA